MVFKILKYNILMWQWKDDSKNFFLTLPILIKHFIQDIKNIESQLF